MRVCNVRKAHRPHKLNAFLADNVHTTIVQQLPCSVNFTMN